MEDLKGLPLQGFKGPPFFLTRPRPLGAGEEHFFKEVDPASHIVHVVLNRSQTPEDSEPPTQRARNLSALGPKIKSSSFLCGKSGRGRAPLLFF